jgi:catecholate siderophore receptor
VLAHIDTGPVRHDLVAGFEYDDELSSPRFYNASGLTNALVSPNTEQAYNPASTYARVFAKTDTHTMAFYGVDTMKLGEDLQLVVGARYDSFHTRYAETVFSVPPAPINVATGSINTTHVDNVVSYRGALVYKPAENGTVYFSYGTSFNPSAEWLTLLTSAETFAVGNLNLQPEKNKNLEVGTKWSLLDDRLTANASLFRAEKTNARIPDPANPGFNQLAGDQRVDGAEIVLQGQIADGWNISTGYDWLDSNTIKTIAGGPPKGAPLPLTPKHQVTLWTTYMITPEFEIGGGGNFITRRYARTTPTPESAPGYIVFDAMAKYRLSEKFDVQLNAYNLGDKYYFDTLHPNFAVPGAGRSAMLTLNFHY